ncbi:MAG: hypothetical protein ABIB71_00250 [Candidatus Woesearchaeota archaeon]
MAATLDDVKDYLKCAVKNRFTLAGYVFCGTSLGLYYTGFFTNNEPLFFSGAAGLLMSPSLFFATWFGFETFRAYKKMKDRIERDSTIDEKAQKAYEKAPYCSAVGMKTAAIEKGLENLL